MIGRFVELLIEFLKGKEWWPVIRPAFQILSLYVVAVVIAYQYINWRYQFTPELGTFLQSYLVKQITVIFLALALLALVLGAPWKKHLDSKSLARVSAWARAGFRSLIVAGAIVVLAAAAFWRLVPHGVDHIRIQFMEEPQSFDPYAFTYIVYELNRFQSDWHFTLEANTFNSGAASSDELDECGIDLTCFSRLRANGEPFIGITESGLGNDSFWVNEDVVSVISAGQWKRYEPPSIYDYLSYSLIVQSILIHLNKSCSGPPSDAYEQSRTSYGDLFEYLPRRNQMKAAILAAHLSPSGQELLSNCFGLEYMNVCNELLSLEWLHSGRVHDNLVKVFNVTL